MIKIKERCITLLLNKHTDANGEPFAIQWKNSYKIEMHTHTGNKNFKNL